MILALIVLSVIVLFHEFGHFLLARLNNIAVMEFAVGFGPTILSYKSKKSGTRYSVKLLPFGGFCAMRGESEEDEAAEEAGSDKAGSDKEKSMAKGDSFFEKSVLARISVLAAGPLFNFLMAFVFAVVIVFWAGYDSPDITQVSEGSAAEVAGLSAGDVITKIGSRRVWIARDVMLYMSVCPEEDISVQYKRYDADAGKWVKNSVLLDSEKLTVQYGRRLMGITFSGGGTRADSLLSLVCYGAAEVRYTIYAVIDGLGQMIKGKVTGDDIAGPIRIAAIIDNTVQQASPYGFQVVLMNILNLMVMFAANLGIMNLLPIPGLDGGRLVFLLWELITGKPVNRSFEGVFSMAGMAFLGAIMVLVMLNDLKSLF